MLVTLVLAAALAQESPADVARRVRGLANGRLTLVRKVISDPELVQAIEAKNKGSESQSEVKRIDEAWQRNADLPLRTEITTNACAVRLREILQEEPAVSEAFLMDSRGTLVCSLGDIAEYWQGDKPSFQTTFGQGRFLYVGDPVEDASASGTWTVPIGMIVLDGPTKIGAARVSLRVTPEMLNPPTPTPEPTPEPTPASPDPVAADPTLPEPTPTPSPSAVP